MQIAAQGAQTIIYHYDEWHHLIGESAGNGSPLHTYVWRDNTPVAQFDYVPSRRVIYLEADQNNTPRIGRDQSGAIIWQWQSDAFGTTKPTASTGVTVNLRFPGQYFDAESDLNYNYARYYDASSGRYSQSDPIGLAGGSYSTYNYVGGNPVSNVDPYGLATYVTNRDLSALGTSARSWADPLTHTFTFSTNPNGSIAATYSWGNAANLQGWNLNQPEDIKAAQQALQNGDAQQVAPSFVDPYYRKAFDQLNNPANNHSNGVLTNNCKTETVKLNDLAWKLLSGGK